MHPTRDDLAHKVREQVVKELELLLADAIDLTLQAKQAHWNIKGADFIALHQLFDDVHAHATAWADDLAERIVALGGDAHGTVQAVARATRVQPWPLETHGAEAHVERLTAAIAQFGSHVRASIARCAEFGDPGSADLCTSISRQTDKDLWFVEAHLER